ncbi:MAG: hypothetical protein Ct9H300mP25_13000 [Acidobacteriota bacterium]|nr:MAG: hypothetical protein Ct9H300mP25_13000 [Acidobacteriota bacterium]
MSFGTGQIWMNGSLVDWGDANIHIGSHVIHYGAVSLKALAAMTPTRAQRSSALMRT